MNNVTGPQLPETRFLVGGGVQLALLQLLQPAENELSARKLEVYNSSLFIADVLVTSGCILVLM